MGDFAVGGGRYCLGFGGASVGGRVSEEILRVLSPLGIRASLTAREQLAGQQDERRHAMQLSIEQLEYDAARAFEPSVGVAPGWAGRLVRLERPGAIGTKCFWWPSQPRASGT